MQSTDLVASFVHHGKSLSLTAIIVVVAMLANGRDAFAAKDEPIQPAEWKPLQRDLDTLSAQCRYEEAFQKLGDFIKANPVFGPAYERRLCLSVDWLDWRDEIAPVDIPLRYRMMHDPMTALGNSSPPSDARRIFLQDWYHENYVPPAEFKLVESDSAACRLMIGSPFNEKPFEAFVAEFVGQTKRAMDLVEPRCKDGTATPREYLTYSRLLRLKGDIPGALAAADDAWKSPTIRSQAASRKANMLRAARRNQELAAFLEEWKELLPQDPRLLYFRCSNTSDSEAIFKDMEALVKRLPNTPQIRFELASHEMQLHHDADASLNQMNRAVELGSKSLLPQFARSCLWVKKNDPQAALSDATAAITSGPYFNPSYLLRAKIYRRLDDNEAAIRDERHSAWLLDLYELNLKYKRSLGKPDAAYALGNHYFRGKDWKPAVQYLSVCLKQSPKNVDALRNRSTAYLALGKLDAALTDADSLVKVAPEPGSYSLRGDVYVQRKEWDNAVADLERARCLDDRLEQALMKRADWHQSKGRIEQSKADLERAEKVSQAVFTHPSEQKETSRKKETHRSAE